MNPLLIEALARDRAERPATPTSRWHRLPPRRPLIGRFGEVLIDIGTKLAFRRFDPKVVGMRQSW